MKNIKWLSNLAGKNPLLFSLVLLMIAIGALASVIVTQDRRYTDCEKDKKDQAKYYQNKFDSLETYYRRREYQLNEEVKITLNSIIEDYKDQLEEQKSLSKRVSTTIKRNRNLISKNKSKIKSLK